MDRDRWGHDQPEPGRRAMDAAARSDGDTDADSDEYEEVTTVTRTLKKTTYRPRPPDQFRIQDTNKKLFGKDLSEYDNMDMDDMLDQLTTEEIDMLTRDVDPDDSLMPPDQRTAYRCDKSATGPLDRKQLIDHINEQALNEPDREEKVPFEPGIVRGKKWVRPPTPENQQRTENHTDLDMEEEDESALRDAKENELVDLAAILGFHSMMNQDQYHASLLGKKLDAEEVGWSGITRASRPKPMAPEPPNTTDPEVSIERVKKDDPDMRQLNLNNIKTISDSQFGRLCQAAASNTRLEGLLISNTAMGDAYAEQLVQLIENNSNIKEISIESNFISPPMIARLIKALLKHKSVETFRAANQRSQVLGNKIEMEITKYVEQNANLLQLGLHFDFNDARARVSGHLQKNRDRFRSGRIKKPEEQEGEPHAPPDHDVSDDYSIQLPATDKLPPRSGGQLTNGSAGRAADRPDAVGDDVRRTAEGLAERAARAADDLTRGLTTVAADSQRVADDVRRAAHDVEMLVDDVQTAVADAAYAVDDIERVAARVEKDFLDGDAR